ncbi:MAG: hypothetical protein KDB68_00075 [Planctomycetes bacterium]|nr:hypothetical protein [Planctomycetota bacterium]MCA8934574.1 hypothetical protein [Planctomycetota bacterium]MCA8944860.1 hypothetical protein [Planctomycetota bacterium]
MSIRDKGGIKTRALAEFNVRWDEYSTGIKLVSQVIKAQIRHGTGDLNAELSKAFRKLGKDVIECIVDEL